MSRDTSIRVALVMVTGGALAFAAFASPPAMQAPGTPLGADYTGKAFNFVRITDDIYHAVGTGALNVGCNGAVIINSDDVLVADSHISPAAAWALREELKAITPKPIRYVVNTHFHFDHAHGNQIYGPGVEIIGHTFTRAQLASGASMSGRSYASFVGTLPDQIAQLKSRAAAAPAADRAKLEAQLAVMERSRVSTSTAGSAPMSSSKGRSGDGKEGSTH